MDTIKETIVEENTIKSNELFECEMLMVRYKQEDIQSLETITKAIVTIINNSLETNKDKDHEETLKIMQATHKSELELITKYIGFLKGDIEISLSDSEAFKGVRYKPQMWSYFITNPHRYQELGIDVEKIKSYLN
ncbi:hypothetical protein QCQ60_005129 [Bacillus cereus]|nr:hypothetical protein [Bacillus cereus]